METVEMVETARWVTAEMVRMETVEMVETVMVKMETETMEMVR